MKFLSRIRARPMTARRAPSLEPPSRPSRPIGDCPRDTPGCIYADCSPAGGKSCYGAAAPIHVDMFAPEELAYGLSHEEAAMLRAANLS
jgi:hypothetical protein